MIVADTGAVFSLFNRRDKYHSQFVELFRHEPIIYVPTGALGELAYLLEVSLGIAALDDFLKAVESGFFLLAGSEADVKRIRELVVKYADMPLGFCDAAVISLTERSGGRVATTDRRHFTVVRVNTPLTLLPEL